MLPNPWDQGSAVYLSHLGFKALATTSAGFAFSKGLPDEPDAVSLEVMLEHFREIAAATPLPVNADFQNGCADDPESVATNVKLCVATGVAGLSIEDSTGRRPKGLYDFNLAIARLKAARRAIDATGMPVVLTARCEAWLVGDSDPLRTALTRLVAFAEAGADCLYAPGVWDKADIAAMVQAVAPRPVNVLIMKPDRKLEELAELGVRRISIGGALAAVGWAAVLKAVEDMKGGAFTTLGTRAPGSKLNALFGE